MMLYVRTLSEPDAGRKLLLQLPGTGGLHGAWVDKTEVWSNPTVFRASRSFLASVSSNCLIRIKAWLLALIDSDTVPLGYGLYGAYGQSRARAERISWNKQIEAIC